MKQFQMDGWVTRGANGAPGVTVRRTQSGSQVTSFRVNSPDYAQQGQQKTNCYFECEYWHSGPDDRKAALIQEGACLLMTGQIVYDTWTDKNTGQQRSSVKFKVRDMGRVFEPQQGGARPAQQYPPAPQQAYAAQAYQAAPCAPQAAAYAPQAPQQAYAPAPQAYAPQAPQAYAQQAAPEPVYGEEIPF